MRRVAVASWVRVAELYGSELPLRSSVGLRGLVGGGIKKVKAGLSVGSECSIKP